MPPAEARSRRSRAVLVAALAAVGLGLYWSMTLAPSPAFGWDESMHVGLPAARMRLAVAEGRIGAAFDALLDCAQYPFAQPLFLAIAPSQLASTDTDVRHWVIFQWAATLVGSFVLVRSALRRRDAEPSDVDGDRADLAAWVAFTLAALSTLSLIYAGTLFLEVPSACAGVWTLVAWLAFWRRPTRKRALIAGALVTLSIFVKWNYGLMLAVGLAADGVVRLLPREGRAQRLRALVGISWIPLVALAWWFLLPLPGGASAGAQHREALFGFLGGNTELEPVPAGVRLFHLLCSLAPTPRLLVVELLGLAAALWLVRDAAVRTLAIVLVAMWGPVFAHPFFQDRFLVPGGPVFFALAAIGLVAFLSRATRKGGWPARVPFVTWTTSALSIVLAVLPLKGKDAPIDVDTAFVARATGLLGERGSGAAAIVHDYKLDTIARRQTLGRDRVVPGNGLELTEARAILDLVAMEAQPDERVGWLCMSSEISPALVHFGRLERGGSRATFLRDAGTPMGTSSDPRADAAAVRAFAEPFDVVFLTDPPDVKGRADGRWGAAARAQLLGGGGWTEREIGEVEIASPMGAKRPVKLFACRPIQ
jgi:hypothetical protein